MFDFIHDFINFFIGLLKGTFAFTALYALYLFLTRDLDLGRGLKHLSAIVAVVLVIISPQLFHYFIGSNPGDVLAEGLNRGGLIPNQYQSITALVMGKLLGSALGFVLTLYLREQLDRRW